MREQRTRPDDDPRHEPDAFRREVAVVEVPHDVANTGKLRRHTAEEVGVIEPRVYDSRLVLAELGNEPEQRTNAGTTRPPCAIR